MNQIQPSRNLKMTRFSFKVTKLKILSCTRLCEELVVRHKTSCFKDNFISDSYINYVMAYLSNPWVLLLIAIAIYYLIQRLELNIKYQNWKEQRQYAAEAEHVKKNPDFYRARMEAMERARQKQQVLFLKIIKTLTSFQSKILCNTSISSIIPSILFCRMHMI